MIQNLYPNSEIVTGSEQNIAPNLYPEASLMPAEICVSQRPQQSHRPPTDLYSALEASRSSESSSTRLQRGCAVRGAGRAGSRKTRRWDSGRGRRWEPSWRAFSRPRRRHRAAADPTPPQRLQGPATSLHHPLARPVGGESDKRRDVLQTNCYADEVLHLCSVSQLIGQWVGRPCKTSLWV